MNIPKRFTLQNMQTYFKNYVPCDKHRQQPIANFCLEPNCYRIMCPQCVEIHSKQFEHHQVESIRSCISRSSKKIQTAIGALQNQGLNSFPNGAKTPEELSSKIITGLRLLREEILDEVKACFDEHEKQIHQEIHTKWKAYQQLAQSNEKLQQAIQELKELHQSLFLTTHTVQSIKRVSMLDFKSLVEFFKTQSQRAKSLCETGLSVTIDEGKRNQIRKLLFSLVEVGKGVSAGGGGARAQENNLDRSQKVVQYQPGTERDMKDDKRMVVNAARSLYPAIDYSPAKTQKGSIDITQPNSMIKNPFLHFFETSSKRLHILPLEPLQKQQVQWKIINLKIDFQIPTFHKSIALRNGIILLIGGSIGDKKLTKIFQYQPTDHRLLQVQNLQTARSSHCIACINQRIYIVGGFSSNGTPTNKCQLFDASTLRLFKMPDSTYASSNSSLTSINSRQLVKIGGMLADDTSCFHIQLYDCERNVWQTIDPTVEQFQGEFSLLSSSASLQINENQILVFGGYNEENDSDVSDMSFVFQWDDRRNYRIRDINLKPLPLAEGFWNNTPVVFNRKLYCLQNVADANTNNCLEDKRNILVFNGRLWRFFDV